MYIKPNTLFAITKIPDLTTSVCKCDSGQAEEDWEFTQEIHYWLHFHV